MVPEGIISIAQIVAEGSILMATLVIAVYTLAVPRVPELREAIFSVSALAKTDAEQKALRKSQEDMILMLDFMVYWSLIVSSLSFIACILAMDAASTALALDGQLTSLPHAEAANFWLVGAMCLLALCFIAVLITMRYAQAIIAIVEKWRKRPPKEFERFRP
jgi:hypothetical protein